MQSKLAIDMSLAERVRLLDRATYQRFAKIVAAIEEAIIVFERHGLEPYWLSACDAHLRVGAMRHDAMERFVVMEIIDLSPAAPDPSPPRRRKAVTKGKEKQARASRRKESKKGGGATSMSVWDGSISFRFERPISDAPSWSSEKLLGLPARLRSRDGVFQSPSYVRYGPPKISAARLLQPKTETYIANLLAGRASQVSDRAALSAIAHLCNITGRIHSRLEDDKTSVSDIARTLPAHILRPLQPRLEVGVI